MGWKNVKEHYGIKHIVHVRDGKIYIGSPYVSEIIEIADGAPQWKTRGLSRKKDDPLDHYMAAMEADPAMLRHLIVTPDRFERSLPVWTCDCFKGEIIAKQCEDYGWPHVTHDGELMYENSFSASRAEVVEDAKGNAAAGLESADRRIAEIESDLVKQRERREQWAAAVKKLEAET